MGHGLYNSTNAPRVIRSWALFDMSSPVVHWAYGAQALPTGQFVVILWYVIHVKGLLGPWPNHALICSADGFWGNEDMSQHPEDPKPATGFGWQGEGWNWTGLHQRGMGTPLTLLLACGKDRPKPSLPSLRLGGCIWLCLVLVPPWIQVSVVIFKGGCIEG